MEAHRAVIGHAWRNYHAGKISHLELRRIVHQWNPRLCMTGCSCVTLPVMPSWSADGPPETGPPPESTGGPSTTESREDH